MDFYSYWYFTIYSIYQRFSKDKYFEIFAASMFSFLVSCLTIGLIGLFLFALKIPGFLLNIKIYIMFPVLITFITNYIIYTPKRRLIRLYKQYKENQNTRKDILSIFLSIVSIALFVLAVKGNQYLNK